MKNIMIQGTGSAVGKSLMCVALCRIFSDACYKTFPFKSQNMSSNFTVTAKGEKMSSIQAIQALAARAEPSAEMNPILLVPKTNSGANVIINGKDSGLMEAGKYFEYKKNLKPMLSNLYRKVQDENDVVVIEGAGSPAEINLNQNDIVNMGMAKIADAPVILVGDIDRGGVFAHFYGTVMLLNEEERAKIKGLIINKFRGDISLLESGIKMIEDLLSIPVIGVVPYINIALPEEDSLYDIRENTEKANTIDELNFEIDKLATHIKKHCNMDYIYKLVGLKH